MPYGRATPIILSEAERAELHPRARAIATLGLEGRLARRYLMGTALPRRLLP